MKSRNFEILRSAWPELASLGGFAEASRVHLRTGPRLPRLELLSLGPFVSQPPHFANLVRFS
jgi:hypothetical protein